MPAMFATLFTIFPKKEQQFVAIMTGVIATSASALGPHMGGWISDEIGWRNRIKFIYSVLRSI